MTLSSLFSMIVAGIIAFMGIILGIQKRKITKQATRIDTQTGIIGHKDKQIKVYKINSDSTTAENDKQKAISEETNTKVKKVKESKDAKEVIHHSNDDISAWNSK